MNIPVRYRMLFVWLYALLKCKRSANQAWIANPAETINRQIATAEIVLANFWRRNTLDNIIKTRLCRYIINLESQRNWYISMNITAVGYIPRG